MPFLRRQALLAALVVATLAGCDFMDHESGREFGVGLVTPLGLSQTRSEVVQWLQTRGGYIVVETRDRFVRAEKVRGDPGNEVDELTVTLETDTEGTRVSIDAQTFVVAGGSRFRADHVSGQARGDAGDLALHLTRLTAPR